MFPKCQHYPIKVYNRVFFFLILIAVENRTVKKITTKWKILKKMVVPDHLTCLLRNLYAGQEATVRTLYRTTDRLKIEKGIQQGCLLSPCLSNLYAELIIQNARLHKLQAGIKISRRNINNLSYANDTTLVVGTRGTKVN